MTNISCASCIFQPNKQIHRKNISIENNRKIKGRFVSSVRMTKSTNKEEQANLEETHDHRHHCLVGFAGLRFDQGQDEHVEDLPSKGHQQNVVGYPRFYERIAHGFLEG